MEQIPVPKSRIQRIGVADSTRHQRCREIQDIVKPDIVKQHPGMKTPEFKNYFI